MSGLVAVEAGTLLILLLLIIWFATFLGRAVQAALALGIIESVALTVLEVPGAGSDPVQFATVFAGLLFLLGEVALLTWAPAVALRLLRRNALRAGALTTAIAAVLWTDVMLMALVWPLWQTADMCIFPAGLVPNLKYPARPVCEVPGYPALVAIVALVLCYVVAGIGLLWPRSPRRGSGRSTTASQSASGRLTRAS